MTTRDQKLRIVFMGSPDFAVPALKAVHERFPVLMVVTQPDRRQGRGRKLMPPAVKCAAEGLGLPIYQPQTIRRKSVRHRLIELDADLFVVVAYGHILRPKMLAVPKMGCVNVHASLLPAYRGAAPIQWAVLNGEACSGVTIMQMDQGMDTGPMLLQQAIDLDPQETAGSLHDKLAPLGAELLIKALCGLLDGSVAPRPQPEEGSVAPMLSKQDGQIDFSRPGKQVDCRIRGLDPWPGAFTTFRGKRLKLFHSSYVAGHSGKPGEVTCVDGRGLLVACGEGGVCIKDLQLPGRRCMFAGELIAGCPIPSGTILGA